jgi:hypothetical protein
MAEPSQAIFHLVNTRCVPVLIRKHEPNEVDAFMIMDDNFHMGSLVGEVRLLFVDHGVAQDHFGCSVFWMRRMAAIGGEQAAIEDWQIKRDGTERGIVEIMAG